MTLTSSVTITSSGTKHRAWNIDADEWRVSWWQDQPLSYDQAVAAMQVAELLGTLATNTSDGLATLPPLTDQLGMLPVDAVTMLTSRDSWSRAVRDSDLPWPQKALLLLLGSYLHPAGGYRCPSVAELARTTGLVEQNIVDLLMELESTGWFSWHAVTGADINTVPERALELEFAPAQPV